MRRSATENSRVWRIAAGATAALLAIVALLRVPPGTLPVPSGEAMSDALIAHWPNAHFLRESVLTHHQWPLWNPLRMLGQPFAANPLSKVWYPPQWLVLIFPPTLHLNLLIYLHLGWLALGVVAWARAERLHPAAGVFAALAWGLNSKLMAHLGAGHLDIVYALAWTPWLLWAVRTLADAHARPTFTHAVRLAAIAAMLFLADVRIAAYMLGVGLLYGLALMLDRHARRLVLGLALAAGALFVLLTTVQTVPLLALSASLTRMAITPADAALYSLPPAHFAGLFLPDPGGSHEWMTYVGLPVVVLAVAGVAQRRAGPIRWLWLGVTVAAALWSLGENGPLFMSVARVLPFVSWLRVPSRAWFVVSLALVILAALGLDGLMHGSGGRRLRLVAVATAFAGLVWAAAVWVAVPDAPPALLTVGLSLLGTGAGLWFFAAEQLPGLNIPREAIGAGILTIVLVALLGVLSRTLVDGLPLDEVNAPDAPLIAALDGSCGPVYSPSFDLIGPAAAQAGIPTIHGVDPFQLSWSAEAIGEAAGARPTGYSVTAPPLPEEGEDYALALSVSRPDAERLAALGTATVAARFPLDVEGLSFAGRTGDFYLYSVAGSDPVVECHRPPNRLFDGQVEVPPGEAPMVFVLPQSWAPGWQARVDGQRVPVQRIDGALIGVPIDSPGAHAVEVVYRPLPDLIGAAVSGVTALALAGWAGVRIVRSRKQVRRSDSSAPAHD